MIWEAFRSHTFLTVSNRQKPSEVYAVFADLAEESGVFDDEFTRKEFLEKIDDWDLTVKPAYLEHKYALGYGIFGTPKFVLDDKLLADTESSWGPDEWAEKLKSLKPKADE